MPRYYGAIFEDSDKKWRKLAWEDEARNPQEALKKVREWLDMVRGPVGTLFVDTTSQVAQLMNELAGMMNDNWVVVSMVYDKMRMYAGTEWKNVPPSGPYVPNAVDDMLDGRVSIVSTHGTAVKILPTKKFVDEVLRPAEKKYTLRQVHCAIYGGEPSRVVEVDSV